MSAQPAYRYDYAYRHNAEPAPSPRIHVVPGNGRRPDTVDPTVLRFLRIALVALIAFTVLGCVRIAFASATVTASMEASAISTEIESARSEGKSLEVKETQLSSTTYLKDYAKKNLNMVEASYTESLVLSADVVAVDEAGNLSLSKSLGVVAGK